MLLILIATIFQPTWAKEQKPLNLGLTPKKEATIQGEVNTSEVVINGAKYIKIEAGDATLLIPKLDQYRPETFDGAFCGSRMGAPLKREAMVTQLEAKLTPSLKAYSALIAVMLRTKCDGTVPEGRPSPRLEFGITYQPEGAKNKNLKYRGFVTPKGLGVGADF